MNNKHINLNEVVTRGILRETLREEFDRFALIIGRSFMAVEQRIDQLEARIDKLEMRIDKFEKSTEGRFDRIDQELKGIRHQLDNTVSRADVAALETRVDVIERKLETRREPA